MDNIKPRPRTRNIKRGALWLAATGTLALTVLLMVAPSASAANTTYYGHTWVEVGHLIDGSPGSQTATKTFYFPSGTFYGGTTVDVTMAGRANGCSGGSVAGFTLEVNEVMFMNFDPCAWFSTATFSWYTVALPRSAFFNDGSANTIQVNNFDMTPGSRDLFVGAINSGSGDSNAPGRSFSWQVGVTHYAPSAPQNVDTDCAVSGIGLRLLWDAPVYTDGGAVSFYRILDITGGYTVDWYGGEEWSDTPVWSSEPRQYRVAAVNYEGVGDWSPIVSRAPCDLVKPGVTGNPSATGWSNAPVLSGVTWSDDYSRLSSAEYSVGTSSGAMDILGWTATPSQPTNAWEWTPSWSPATLAQGLNYVNMRVFDRAGNMLVTNGAYTVHYDTGLPTVTGPLSLGWRNAIPAFTGVSWTDGASGLAFAEYSIGSAGGLTNIRGWTNLPTQPSGQTTAWNPSWSPPALAQGTNHINMRVTDVAGNVLTTNSAYTVQFDTVVPGLPTITSTSHPLQTRYYQATTFSGNAQATDNTGASGMSGIYRHLTASSTCPASLDGVGTFVAGSTIPASYSGLGPFETRSFCAQAKDNAGNLGAVARYQVNVNTIAPTITTVGTTGVTDDAHAPVFGRYNAEKGGLDPPQPTSKTTVDPAAVHLTIDGSIDVVTFWMATPICAPIWTAACPVTVDSDHVEYRPVAPWTNGVHSVLLSIGDTTLPAVTASQAWTFTEATVASCPPGTTGTVIQGIPVCVSTGPCPSGTIGLVIQGEQVCVPVPTTCDGGETGVEAGETEICEPNPCATPVGPGGPGELVKVCGIAVPNGLPGDEDADNVPDNQEPALCSQENPNILSDGHCTGSDYTLPTWSDVVSDVIWLATGTRP